MAHFFPHLWFAAFIFQALALCIRQSSRKSHCSLPHRVGSPSHTFATLGRDLPHKQITCEAEAQPLGKYKNSPSPCRERAAWEDQCGEGVGSEDGRADPSRAEGSGGHGSSKDEGVNKGDKIQDHNLPIAAFHTHVIQY